MRRRLLSGLAVGVLIALPVSAQTVDEIIAKNLQAKGGLQKLKAVQTARMAGTMTVGPGMEAPFVIEFKRPNQMRLDFTLQGMTGTQAYDGKTGWMLMPFSGRKDPEPMPTEALKQAEEQADFDGPLVDYQAKGHKVELVGKEKVEGSDAYKLKVTLKNGDIRYIYLDADQYLEIKVDGKTTIRGTEIENSTSIGDYKEVGGLMLPHAMESTQAGSPQSQKMTIEKIELNVPIDDARFKMPEVKKEEPKKH
jgi:outer membrane lipoprotein-sorting protein